MVPSVMSDIRYKVDVNTMKKEKDDAGDELTTSELALNEIGRCHIAYTARLRLMPMTEIARRAHLYWSTE